MQYRPQVRRDELTLEKVGDDLLVYDSRHLKAHRLNSIAAFVLRFSDGTRTVQEIASCLQTELGSPADDELVWFALEKLAKVDLLTEVVSAPQTLDISRRSLLRKARAAAAMVLVLPVIESVLAPSPAQAQPQLPPTPPLLPIPSIPIGPPLLPIPPLG
jgi:hypothetical protein